MKLLLAEDEDMMADALAELLRQENYDVDRVADGIAALSMIEKLVYDCIILDVMMPGMSGFEVSRETRKRGIKTPILILSAKGELDDKVKGLDSGADDYLTKPFMTEELLARLRALCRRGINSTDGSLTYEDIKLHPESYTLECVTNGQSCRLSEKEYKILEYLIANQGQIITREQLILKIWGYDNDAEYNNVEVYMTFTRKKLAFVDAKTHIKAVRGLGYELRFEDV